MSRPRSAIPANPDPEIFSLPGPQAIRKMVFPCQRLQLQDAARILGCSYLTIYRRSIRGNLGFDVRVDPETGHRYVLVDDLIQYIFPADSGGETRLVIPPAGKKKRGRPRNPVF
jgi:hypothetical protein